MVAARCAYRFHHRGGGRGIRADLVLCIIALYAAIVVRSLLRLMTERDPFIRLREPGLRACLACRR